MKPQPHRRPDAPGNTGSIPLADRSTHERGMHAINARPPPAVPYRRYPSLSDDGQPYFPRLRRARRTADATPTMMVAANDNDRSPFFSVRAFALLAIVAIVAALVAAV
jgi:hypothetical protein